MSTPVRFGAGFVWLNQTYVDGVQAHDYRGQLSGMFIFGSPSGGGAHGGRNLSAGR